MDKCTFVHLYVHVCVCAHMCVYTCMCVHVHGCVCVCVCVHVRIVLTKLTDMGKPHFLSLNYVRVERYKQVSECACIHLSLLWTVDVV